MANERIDLRDTTLLPKWGTGATDRPTIPSSLEQNGFVPGDLPQVDDINRIGFDQTKWIENLRAVVEQNVETIDSVVGDYSRSEAYIDPPVPSDPKELSPNLNHITNKKIKSLENQINPIYYSLAADKYNGLPPEEKGIDKTLRRLITSYDEQKPSSTEDGSLCLDGKVVHDTSSGQTDLTADSYCIINSGDCFAIKDGTGKLEKKTIATSLSAKLIDGTLNTFSKFVDTNGGVVDYIGVQNKSDVAIYFVEVLDKDDKTFQMAVGTTSIFSELRDVMAINFPNYKNFWYRRIMTTKVIEIVIDAAHSYYKLLRMEQKGNNAIYIPIKYSLESPKTLFNRYHQGVLDDTLKLLNDSIVDNTNYVFDFKDFTPYGMESYTVSMTVGGKDNEVLNSTLFTNYNIYPCIVTMVQIPRAILNLGSLIIPNTSLEYAFQFTDNVHYHPDWFEATILGHTDQRKIVIE